MTVCGGNDSSMRPAVWAPARRRPGRLAGRDRGRPGVAARRRCGWSASGEASHWTSWSGSSNGSTIRPRGRRRSSRAVPRGRFGGSERSARPRVRSPDRSDGLTGGWEPARHHRPRSAGRPARPGAPSKCSPPLGRRVIDGSGRTGAGGICTTLVAASLPSPGSSPSRRSCSRCRSWVRHRTAGARWHASASRPSSGLDRNARGRRRPPDGGAAPTARQCLGRARRITHNMLRGVGTLPSKSLAVARAPRCAGTWSTCPPGSPRPKGRPPLRLPTHMPHAGSWNRLWRSIFIPNTGVKSRPDHRPTAGQGPTGTRVVEELDQPRSAVPPRARPASSTQPRPASSQRRSTSLPMCGVQLNQRSSGDVSARRRQRGQLIDEAPAHLATVAVQPTFTQTLCAVVAMISRSESACVTPSYWPQLSAKNRRVMAGSSTTRDCSGTGSSGVVMLSMRGANQDSLVSL